MRASGVNGAPGLHRLSTAQAPQPGELLLSFAGHYAAATDFLAEGDENERKAGLVLAGFSPVEYLWLFGSWDFVSNHNDALEPRYTGYRGNPAFGLEGRYPLRPELSLGVGLSATIPTSADGSGLAPEAALYRINAAFSFEPRPGIVLAANAGYTIDYMLRIYDREVSAAERYVAGIYGEDAATYGLGAQALFPLSPAFAAGGFAEFTGSYAVSPRDAVNPVRASAGLKLLALSGRNLELAVGGDLRVAGAPEVSSPTPGLPPWEAFARLVGRWAFFHAEPPPPPPPPPPPSPPPCGPTNPCGDGLVCEAGACVEAPPPPPPPTFEIRGRIIDKATAKAIPAAKLKVSGVGDAKLVFNKEKGEFLISSVLVNEGLVALQVEAAGYHAAEKTLPKGPPNAVAEVEFELLTLAKTVPGVIRGMIIDVETGKSVRGRVSIRGIKKKIVVDEKGAFDIEVKAGRYEVYISSPRYVPQTKTVELTAGDVVILNIDLTPRRR